MAESEQKVGGVTMKRIVAGALLAATAMSGCAGRTPAPVAIIQPQDRYMNCSAIMAEVQSNNAQVSKLGKEEGEKVAQNVAVGAVGLFIPILWFGMDFQGAAGKETTALQSRQQYLATMAENKHCADDPSLAASVTPGQGNVTATPASLTVAAPAPAPAPPPAK